jgi:hypothetical protein
MIKGRSADHQRLATVETAVTASSGRTMGNMRQRQWMDQEHMGSPGGDVTAGRLPEGMGKGIPVAAPSRLRAGIVLLRDR